MSGMRTLLILLAASFFASGCSQTCETNADCLPPSTCVGCPAADDDDSSDDITYREDCTVRRCTTPAELRSIQNQS